jgi:hypothetical protein
MAMERLSRRSAVRAAAIAFPLTWLASVGEAQILSLSQDQRAIEGTGAATVVPFSVFLDGPSATAVTVNYRTVAGTATGPSDYVVVTSGSVTLNPGETNKPLPAPNEIRVQGDPNPEWSTLLQQDDVFYVELFNPVNAVIDRGWASVTIVDDDQTQPGVQYLSVVTDSTGSGGNDGRNRLQWRVPAAPTSPNQFKVCWKSSATACASPLSDTDTDPGGCEVINGPFTAGARQLFTHDNTRVVKVQVPRNYCYSVFTIYGGFSPERGEASVKTFDSTPGPVKWTFTPGHYNGAAAPSVLPPTVGPDGVYTVGTDGVVHAMDRGPSGGLWPALWNPLALGKPAHSRSPVVSTPALGARMFVSTEDGEVHALDARRGLVFWSRSGAARLMTSSVGDQAAPAGIFRHYGGPGVNDLLLMGTANGASNTEFFALNPASGALIDKYPTGGETPPPIHNVYGMPVVDYGANRVYFATTGGGVDRTVWALDLGPAGAPDLTLSTLPWNPKPLGVSGTIGSLVLRGGRLYLGTDSGAAAQVHSLRLSDGFLYSYPHGDGQVKGFTWPDRRDGRIYFSTSSRIHALNDDGTQLLPAAWSPLSSFNTPSMLLQRPGTDDLYIGDGDGRLIKINAGTGATTPLPLATTGVLIGAPSLDNFHNLIHVGSDKGVVYAVAPF